MISKEMGANSTKYFSKTYQEAREKFLDLTKNWNKESHNVRENLFIDIALYNQENAKKLVILTSGVHGPEGFAGSAAQLLFIEEFISKLNQDTGIAIVHILNPYGMKNNRRVNESNVDLNRSFLASLEDFKEDNPKMRELLDSVSDSAAPKYRFESILLEQLKFYLRILSAITKYGYNEVKQASLGGQYRYSKNLSFGGGQNGKFEKSVKIYQEFLDRISKNIQTLILIDLHTGMKKTEYIVSYSEDSDKFKSWKKVNKKTITDLKSKADPKNAPTYYVKGSLPKYTDENSKAKNNFCMTLDFGTGISPIKLAFLAIAENQINHFGAKSEKIAQKISQQFREALYPSNPEWKTSTLQEARDFFNKICQEFELI